MSFLFEENANILQNISACGVAHHPFIWHWFWKISVLVTVNPLTVIAPSHIVLVVLLSYSIHWDRKKSSIKCYPLKLYFYSWQLVTSVLYIWCSLLSLWCRFHLLFCLWFLCILEIYKTSHVLSLVDRLSQKLPSDSFFGYIFLFPRTSVSEMYWSKKVPQGLGENTAFSLIKQSPIVLDLAFKERH